MTCPLPSQISAIDPAALNTALLTLAAHGDFALALKRADTGAYLWADDTWCRLFGLAPEAVPGHADLELLPPHIAMAQHATEQRILAAEVEGASTAQLRLECAGRTLELSARYVALPGADGTRQILMAVRDETPARQQAEQLRQALAQIERQQQAFDELLHQQRHESPRLTALFRHEQFEDHLRREFALSQREQREFALAVMALDDYPALCRRHGRYAAERAAETVGQLLRSRTRAMDVITRVSDDRYAVLLSGVGLATAHTRMEQLRRLCATQIVVHEGVPLAFEVSVGVASFPHSADSLAALGEAAERALAEAIIRGGNRVALASISLRSPPHAAAAAVAAQRVGA